MTTLRNSLILVSAVPMTRKRHPKPELEAELRYAERYGWRVVPGGSHAWGRLACPRPDRECRCGEFCLQSIWSTPRNPGHHTNALRRVVDHCTRREEAGND